MRAKNVRFGLENLYSVNALCFCIATVTGHFPVLTWDRINEILVFSFGDTSFFLFVLLNYPVAGIQSLALLDFLNFDPLIFISELTELYLADLSQVRILNLLSQGLSNTSHFSTACWRIHHVEDFKDLKSCMASKILLLRNLTELDCKPLIQFEILIFFSIMPLL